MASLKSDGKFPVKEVSVVEEEHEGDKVKEIEVSGGNISLVVDFSGSLTGNCPENVVESDGAGLNEDPVKENQAQEFLGGNLVWAMTKNKKWWPGEVVGFKADAKESFMVRYLGDSHPVSWCAPSKLKPFKESFAKVVNQGNDKGFFAAVNKAMFLLGNSLKVEMACSCNAEGNEMTARYGKTRKKNILILREFSVDRLEPKSFVAELKNIGRWDSDGGLLETTVMQSRLSAFYSFFGYKQIPMDQLHRNEGRKSFTAKMKDSQFIGSPSIVAGSSRRTFRKQWFRKFVSEVDNVSAKGDLVNTSPSDLISKLKLLAVDYKCSKEMESMDLFEWFFSKFRISVFLDENAYKTQLADMAGLKDLMVAKDKIPQKSSKSKKVVKSKIKLFGGVSDADTKQQNFESEKLKINTISGLPTAYTEKKASMSMKSGEIKIKHFMDFVTREPCGKDFQDKSSVQSSEMKASKADTLSIPLATHIPDLNNGGYALGTAEFHHLQRPGTLIPPNVCRREEEIPGSMRVNFQAMTAPCSTYGVSGTQFVSNQPALVKNITNTELFPNVTSSEKKKRGRKRKNAEELPIGAHVTTGIPDLNRISTEPASVPPQAEPRRRRKKEESALGITKTITILFLKFTSQISMPSRDDLTSTFSAFGPLDSSETHVSEGFSLAQVAFVSSGDAIEAIKSLQKANPFGEALVSYRLQQKLITIQRNKPAPAPRMPSVSQVSSPIPKLNNNSTASVDSMKQNLMMMTSMLEKSGESLSREMKEKLKSEISGLLERVSSMPSSSSS